MEIISHSEQIDLKKAVERDEPFLAAISFDSATAHWGHSDEYPEHHILLQKAGLPSTDMDRYFRIVFDREGADWTFVCPPTYRGIEDKHRRLAAFYNDGFTAISGFLSALGYFVDIKIPKRYRRRFDAMSQ